MARFNMRKLINIFVPESIKKILRQVRSILVDEYATKSYSQEGEDMILNRIFEGKRQGFYVDIGAHHPRRFSNTYFFYKRGWSGINVEPNPDVVRIFKSDRSRDINLQCGVSDCEGTLKYHYFNDPALNTFDEIVVRSRLETTPYKLVKQDDIPVVRLDRILKRHLVVGRKIDFLSVDVEGFDLSVLKSNDWDLFRPSCVLAEVLNATLEEAINGEIAKFMREQGYSVFARTYNTLIFRNVRK
jgi:FkbM family methyltransferase